MINVLRNTLDSPQTKKILTSSVGLFGAEFIFKGGLTVLGILLVRSLSLQDYGSYSVALSFSSLFTVLVDFGISTYITREVSKSPDTAVRLFSSTVFPKIIFSIVTSIMIPLLAFILGRRDQDLLLTGWFAIYVSLNGFAIYIHAFLRGLESIPIESRSKMIQGVTLLTLAIGILMIYPSVLLVTISFTVATLLSVIYLLASLKRIFGYLPVQTTITQSLAIIKESWIYGLSGFLALVNLNFDAIFIGFTLGNEQAGIYTAIYTILTALLFGVNIAFIPLFPMLAKRQLDTKFLRSAFLKSFVTCSIGGGVIAIPLGIASKPILSLLYTVEVAEYSSILVILAGVFWITILKNPAGYILSATGKQAEYLKVLILSAGVNVLGNLWLIPRYGISAAAWSTALAETINVICLTYIVWIQTRSQQ